MASARVRFTVSTKTDDLADEADDVLGVVFAVGVVDDAGALVGGDLVLIDDSFEGGAVAEAVFEGVRF